MSDKEIILDNFTGISRNTSRTDMDSSFVWGLYNGYIDIDMATGNKTIRKRGGTVNAKHASSADPGEVLLMGKWDSNTGGGLDNLFFCKSKYAWYQAKVEGISNIELTKVYDLGMTAGDERYENDYCILRRSGVWSQLIICMYNGPALRVDPTGLTPTTAWTAGVSDLSTDTALPGNSTCCHIHQRRVWLNSRAAGEEMIAYGSKLDDPTGDDGFSKTGEAVTLDAGKFISEEDTIIGFRSLGSLLVIFMNNHIAIYNAPVTWEDIAIQQIIPVGAVSNKAIVAYGNDLIFVSHTGIKKLSLTDTSNISYYDLTRNVQSRYDSIYLSPNKPDSCAIYDPDTNLIYFSLASHLVASTDYVTGYEFMVYSPALDNVVGIYQFHYTTTLPPVTYSMYYYAPTKTMLLGQDWIYKFSTDTFTDETSGSAQNYEWKLELPSVSSSTNYAMTALREVKALIESTKELTMKLSYKYANEIAFTDVNFNMEDEDIILSGANLYSVDNVGGRGRGVQFNISNTDDAKIDLESVYVRMGIEGKK